jgi:hypothetical protein
MDFANAGAEVSSDWLLSGKYQTPQFRTHVNSSVCVNLVVGIQSLVVTGQPTCKELPVQFINSFIKVEQKATARRGPKSNSVPARVRAFISGHLSAPSAVLHLPASAGALFPLRHIAVASVRAAQGHWLFSLRHSS